MWKYKDVIMLPCILFPPLGTVLAAVCEVSPSSLLSLSFLSQLIVPRHTLDITIKYSYVPQTDLTYKLDRTSPEIDWSVSEPEKVTVVMPNSRFLLPRDSLSKIVTGQMNWNSAETAARKQLLR